MKCPHCLQAFHENWSINNIVRDNGHNWRVIDCICPSCGKAILKLQRNPYNLHTTYLDSGFVYPKAISRSPIPPEVDDETLKSSYEQSCFVLTDSPMASAALSRRALQHILREKAGAVGSNLFEEIQFVIDSGKLPAELSENLDYMRVVGNFAAHPIKSTNSGEVFDVEPGEAEWNLDVVEDLMEFYFVRPAKAKAKRDAMNIKLRDAGKPELI